MRLLHSRARRCGTDLVRKFRQGACKPGSVRRAVSERTHAARAAIPLGLALPQGSSDQPGRSMRNTPVDPCEPTRRPYSVLLRVGFTMRALLPVPRCALTAPFHPCLCPEGPSAVCSLWHFPWTSLQAGRPAGVTRHPCFVEPGLSSASYDDAAARPPGERRM